MTEMFSFLRRLTRLSAIVTLAIVLNASPASAQSLGSAANFAVLGATTVTNTGTTIVTGDLGLSPGTEITGFPPGVVLVGTMHSADGVAALAQADAGMANAALKAMPCPSINDLTDQVLGIDVLSLPPGVYCFESSAQLTGTLFLTGAGPWIFQVGTTLTTASNSIVAVVGAGTTCSGSNVFWQIGSSATLGTGTQLIGNIVAAVSITLTTGASVSGSALALIGAVTMDTNNVSVCKAGPGNPGPGPGPGDGDGGGDGDDDGDCDEHDDDGDDDRRHCDKDHKDRDHDGDCKKNHHHGDHKRHHGHKDHEDRDHDRDRDGHGDKDHRDKDRNRGHNHQSKHKN